MAFNIKSFIAGGLVCLMGSVIVFGAGNVKSVGVQDTELYLDGRQVTLDKPALLIELDNAPEGSLYLPAIAVFENAGYQVEWRDNKIELKSPHPAMASLGQELLTNNKKDYPDAPERIACGFFTVHSLSAAGDETPQYSKFVELMEPEYNIQPVYLPIGSKIEMAFHYPIDNMAVYSFILNESGGMKYNIPDPLNELNALNYEMSDDFQHCALQLTPNLTAGFSSLSYDYYEGNTLMGYLLRYECQGVKTDTFFIIRTDAG